MTKTCFNYNQSDNLTEHSNDHHFTNGTTGCAKAIFICLPSSHPFLEKEVYLNGKIKIGRTYLSAKQCRDKLFFDSKVLSKSHAVIWYENGKFFLKDTKSSNGTFVNGNRLSVALEESPDCQIYSDDVIQFGVEVQEDTTGDQPQIHSGVYTLLKLYHPNGNLAIRPSEKDEFGKECENISMRQLTILHDCLKLSLNREIILKEKLSYLKTQLTDLEEITKKKWDNVINEDLLLSKVEILQNRIESILNTNNQLKNLNDDNSRLAVLTKEIQLLHDQKDGYQFEFKSAIKKSFDDKRIAESKLKETEIKLETAMKEIKYLEEYVNKCKNDLNTADSEIEELKTYKLEVEKLREEKLYFEKEIKKLEKIKANENSLTETIKDLRIELESKQLELKSIGTLKDIINRSKNLRNNTNSIEQKMIISNNDLDSNTHQHQLNGKLYDNDDDLHNELDNFKNCTEYFKCPINEQSSQKILDLINDYFNKFKNTSDKNEQLLRHVIAILILENKNLFNELELNLNNENHNLKNQQQSIKLKCNKYTNQLEPKMKDEIEKFINNQKLLISKENEINSLNKMVTELQENYSILEIKFNELINLNELKNDKIKEEIVKNDVQNVLDSMIEKVETKITQQDYDDTINKLNQIQNDYNKLKSANKKLEDDNDLMKDEIKTLKDELEMVSYQNKMANLLALIPITILIVSCIFAYLPIINLFTATKDA